MKRVLVTGAAGYGTCKHALQGMRSVFCRQAGISEAWGRIFLTYGPPEEPRLLVADTTQLEQEVGRTSRFDRASGLEQTIQRWQVRSGGEAAKAAVVV